MNLSKADILKIFEENPKTAMRLGDVADKAKMGKRDKKSLQAILKKLRSEGRLRMIPGRRYMLARGTGHFGSDPDVLVGRLTVNPKGYGFVSPQLEEAESDPGPDVFIPPHRLSDAMHGDIVLAHLAERSDPKRPEGRVVSVISRGRRHLVGRFHRLGRRGGVVVPRDQRIGRNVIIMEPPTESELADGSWVQVRLVEFPPPPDDLIGDMVEFLGDDTTQGIDILLILRDYGIVEEFPDEVMEEVARLPETVDQTHWGERRDLRDQMAFTIDGYDAKDFDDALSIESRRTGGYRLWVHIADVSHYVRPETALEAEALSRSTSIYPVDRVVPMLPEKISNDLCSLRPNEDRLTVTVEMDITESGQVEKYELYNSVIRSRYRLNYRDTQSFYDGIENPATRRLERISGDLRALLNLMEILRTNRLNRGALDLDLPEVEIVFDEGGVIENVVRAPRWKSHQIVEECMILANEIVAQFLTEKGDVFLYRIHEKPPLEDVKRTADQLEAQNIHLSIKSNKSLSARLQEALDAASKAEAPHIFNRLILRALTKACYSPKNIGHFGLASPAYLHFTSPIRRYPDLMCHRAVKRVLAEEKVDKEWKAKWDKALPAVAARCSEQERNADAVENEATRICALEFMRGKLGEAFQGHVSGVTNFGLFIELRKYPVDGLLHVRDLHDDHYEFDEKKQILRGRRTGKIFRLGQRVEIIVHRVDTVNQQMDLRLELLEETHPRRGGKLYQSRRRKAW